MTRQEQNAEAGRKFGEAVNAGGIVDRFLGYLVSYVVLVVILVLLLLGSSSSSNAFTRFMNELGILLPVLVFITPALLFFFWERGIIKFRRANGLSIYKNIREELEQMKFNEEYAKEAKAREAYEASKK